jgi:eukaryotic-like serine/threonine-protein kinase
MSRNEQWERVQDLFDEASQLDAGERRQFLAGECAGEPELLREVNELLEHDRAPDQDRFTAAVRKEGEAFAGSHDDSAWRGKRIGAWRIIDKIAEGGMGAVYLADRDDKAYEQRAAVKIIARSAFSSLHGERFRSERQILARLDHHNIARLLDGGELEDGTLYLVMEYVSGTRIDEYCDRHLLTIEERLRLFLQVCDAVQYAHENLIIHRDLKPSNILVTEEGVPKLLDFGIAKPIRDDVADLTVAGQRLMTPKHASPEQLLGERITTASDVYALGVLLYELLSGSFPFDISSSSSADVEQIVTRIDPPAPSNAAIRPVASSIDKAVQLDASDSAARRRLSTAQLVRRLRGDLDAITLKAVSRQPQQRYPTARQLSEDLRRHLENRPVEARSRSRAYRGSRYLRRHRLAAGAATLLLAAAVSAVAFHNARLAAQRDLAQQQAERAGKVAALLADVLSAAAPALTRGTTITPEQLLSHGTERIRQSLADEPLLRADLLGVIGHTYRSLGLYQPAHDLVAESLAIQERLLPADDVRIAESLYELGYTSYELALYDESLAAHERALEMFRNRYGEAPHEQVAMSLREVGLLNERLNRYAVAEDYYRASFEQLEELHSNGSQELALTQTDLAGVMMRTQRYAEAEPLIVNALEMRRRLLGDVHPDVAQGLNNLGFFYNLWGDPVAAEAHLRESLGIRRQLYGTDNALLAIPLTNMARVLLERGAVAESLEYCDQGWTLAIEKLGATHTTTLGNASDRTRALLANGRMDDALLFAARQLGLAEATYNPPNRYLAYLQAALGRAQIAAGNLDKARELIGAARQQQIEMRGAGHLLVWEESLRLYDIDALEGNVDAAIAGYTGFLQRFRGELLETHPEISRALLRLGELHADKGAADEAKAYFDRALTLYEQTQVPESPALARARAGLERL